MTDETLNIPLSEREIPKEIDNDAEGSYTVERLNGDYNLFLGDTEGFDPESSEEKKQRELFKLYEKGEMDDAGQAWEWWIGKKWQHWSYEEAQFAKNNTPEKDKEHLRMLEDRRRRTT